MYKRTINYIDYNGTERKEDYYFNLSKAEILEMEMTTPGGFIEMLQNIIDAKDSSALFKIFTDLILKSYGQKSPDGKKFVKNDTIREDFKQTEAYSILLLELVTNAEEASNFVNKIIPFVE